MRESASRRPSGSAEPSAHGARSLTSNFLLALTPGSRDARVKIGHRPWTSTDAGVLSPDRFRHGRCSGVWHVPLHAAYDMSYVRGVWPVASP